MEPGKPRDLFLDTKLFEFMLCALREMTEPLIGQNKFQVTVEGDLESKKVVVKYRFE